MSTHKRRSNRDAPPGWAVDQARSELEPAAPEAVDTRAREIAADAAQIEAERHDEYDDPDQGGEA